MNRIRTRLMIAILVAALLPAVPMSLVVGNLLERSLHPAIGDELARGLEAGLEVSREELARRKTEFGVLAARAGRQKPRPSPRSQFPPLIVLDERGNPAPLTREANELDERDNLDENPRLISGHLAVQLQGAHGGAVIVAQPIPGAMVSRADDIAEAMSLLAAYQLEREPILRSYIMPFLLVYGILVAAALAVAALFSNSLARPLEEVARAASDVADGNLEIRVTSKTGGEIGALVAAFNGMVANLEQQRSELARLEKLSAWRGMSRMLAHEIKNPLTPILLAVQQAKNSYRGDDEAYAAVLSECESIVSEEVDGLRELVRSFSDFARTPQPEIKEEHLSDLLENLGRLYGGRLDAPRATTVWMMDAAQIKRVLINLIDNGLTACGRAGNEPCVTITVDESNEQLRIKVQDQGDGIAAADLPRIFEPDFTTNSQGMGLGLPIVAGIIEAHGGEIQVAAGPDTGTRFTITLPRAARKETT